MLFDTRLSATVVFRGGDWETYFAVANVLNKLIDATVSSGPSGVQDLDSIGRTFRIGLRFAY